MTNILTSIFLLFSTLSYGQQLSSALWEEQAKTNIRLLPKYGFQPKTEIQKQLDKNFIEETMKKEQFRGDKTAASNHLINLGFNYLYGGDIKTAMYRFNQAYLLDSLNTDIYWGYGAVYMTLGNYEQAKQQYEDGLSKKTDNTHLLTDLGTYFIAQYHELQPVDKKKAVSNLDSAISYMAKSYRLDPKDQNTTFKLSICYWLKGDCDNAWKYYDECKSLGGQPITKEYTKDLKNKCKRKK